MNERLRQIMIKSIPHGEIGFNSKEIYSWIISRHEGFTVEEVSFILDNDKENFRVFDEMNKLRNLSGLNRVYSRIGSVKMMKLDNYFCSGCNAKGVKLWRYPHFAKDFKCQSCALSITRRDKREPRKERSGNFIGSYLPAVPAMDTDTVWGFSSVPIDCVEWWNALPE